MKIYLVLEYKKQGNNVWAEVQAFTSTRQQMKALEQVALKKDADYEGQEVEVSKRAYARDSFKKPLSHSASGLIFFPKSEYDEKVEQSHAPVTGLE